MSRLGLPVLSGVAITFVLYENGINVAACADGTVMEVNAKPARAAGIVNGFMMNREGRKAKASRSK